jgi:hypothetical protein
MPEGPVTWLSRSRVALLGVALALFLYPLLASPRAILSSDWAVFATGAHLALSHPASLYDLTAQRHVQAVLVGGSFDLPGLGGLLPFIEPPWVGLMAIPASLAGVVLGGRLWMVADLAALAVGLFLVTRRHQRAAMLAGLACYPAASMVVNAQIDGFVVLGLATSWVLWTHNRRELAGAALGLTLIKPHLIVPLALGLVAAREWRVVIGWAIVAAALVGVSDFLSPGWLPQAVRLALPGSDNFALAALIAGSPPWATWAMTAGAALGVVTVAARVQSPERRIAILIVGGVLVAPHGFATDFVLIAPALLIARQGGFTTWAVLSAGSLAVALTREPLAAGLLSTVLLACLLVRAAGFETLFGWVRLPSWWRPGAVEPVPKQPALLY